MPEILEKDLLKQIEKREFDSLYFVYGEDVFLRQTYVNKLCEAVVTELPEMNFPKIDGRKADVQRITDETYLFPLMCEKRCVLIEDFDIASLSETSLSEFKEVLSSVPETTVLVFVFNSVEVDVKKNSWKNIISFVNKYGNTINCKYKTDAELVRYIAAWAKKKGVVFEGTAARYLIENVGKDMKKLEVEVDKLCAYKNDYITKQDIDKLSAKTPEATQYMLPKAIFNKNVSQSLLILSDLIDMRFEPIVILNAIVDSFIDVYRAKSAIDAGKRAEELAEQFGYGRRAFVLTNAAKDAKKLSFKTICDCMDVLDDADERLKGGERNPKMLLEQTIVLLIEILRGYKIKV